MPTIPPRPPLRGARHHLLRGYGPALVIVAALVAFTSLVPSVQPEKVTTSTIGLGYSDPSNTAGPDTPNTGAPTASASGGATLAAGGGKGGSAATGPQASTPPGAAGCSGRQVPSDPYSPQCVTWNGGNNGGATSPGVTATTINLSFRMTAIADIGQLVQQISGATGGKVQISETVQDVERTFNVFAQYFSDHFQFYGRKIVLKPFTGQGSLLTELLGGGQAGAQSDAIDAAQQQHAFADIFSLTQPYSEALISQHVIALNELYFSQQWFQAHSPYAYSLIPDCTKVVQGAVNAVEALVGTHGAGNAIYAGGSLKGKPRKIAIIAPDTPVYSTCANQAKSELAALHIPIADFRTYPLDLDSITNSTPQNLVSALSGEGITTVVMATDPVLPFFMTAKAALQNWSPEWVVTGVGLTDADYVGQLYNSSEWSHAFGVSFLGKQVPVASSDANRAYSETSPKTTMAQLTGELVYYMMEMFAIGVQEAGPDLTPATFKQGLERYQGGTGQDGTWGFPASDPYTPNVDSRIVWWNPNGISSYNGQPGTYNDNGHRYPLGKIPPGSYATYLPGFKPEGS